MRLALIGCGYIGGSVALALREVYPRAQIAGLEPRDDFAEVALRRKIIDVRVPTLAAAVADADVVLLAVPVATSLTLLRELAPVLAPTTVVTDVGSVKGAVVEAALRWLPSPSRFVGGHPMAGREVHGPAAADGRLFRGARCLLTPAAETDPVALEWVRESWLAMGATVELLEAATHDRILATASHLPHVVAYALAYSVGMAPTAPRGGGAFAESACALDELMGRTAGSFSDTTRVAASDPHLWRDIFRLNRDALLATVARYRGALDQLVAAIEPPRPSPTDGSDPLMEYLAEARGRRTRLLGDPSVAQPSRSTLPPSADKEPRR